MAATPISPPKNMCVKIRSSPLVSMMKIKHHVNDYHHLVWMIRLPQLLTVLLSKTKQKQLNSPHSKDMEYHQFQQLQKPDSQSNNLNFLESPWNPSGISSKDAMGIIQQRGASWSLVVQVWPWRLDLNSFDQLTVSSLENGPKNSRWTPFHHVRNLPSKKWEKPKPQQNHPRNNLCHLVIFRGPDFSHVTVGVYDGRWDWVDVIYFEGSFRLKMGGYSSLLC